MASVDIDELDDVQPEPRWHAFLAVFAVAGLYFALPDNVIFFEPRWVFPAIVGALVVPILVTHAKELHKIDRVLGFVLNGVLTLGMVVSVGRLVDILTEQKKISPEFLLKSAGLLWVTNVIVFALWYWRLDAGGPHKREKVMGHERGAFLFAQMTMDDEAKKEAGQTDWSPNFIDYLFISFNNSTAFSPTDVPVLSRWAKVLTMLQSIIALTIVALLVARAINTLGGSN